MNHSSNGMAMIRSNNTRNRILNVIRTRGKSYKIEIKNLTRYSMVTVLDTIDQLEKENLIIYTGKGMTKNGRRPTYIELNPDGCFFLGLSFHASEISLTLLDFCGKVRDFYSEFIPEPCRNKEHVLSRIHSILEDSLKKHDDIRNRIKGIGIGSPGYVDGKRGVTIFYPHIPEWREVPLQQLLSDRIRDIPVYIENNTNALALAYKWIRPEEATSSCVILSIRSGVRMSLLVGSALHIGESFTSGEVGHIRVHGSARYCPCGKKGCLDTEVSEISLRNKILEGINVGRFQEIWAMAGQDENKVDTDLYFTSLRHGHLDSLQLLEETCSYLGDSIAQIINIINPSKVVISSRYCELGDLFLTKLRQNIEERAVDISLKALEIEPVAFGEQSAAIGAAAIVMEWALDFVDAII